jgi:hypothetical protein
MISQSFDVDLSEPVTAARSRIRNKNKEHALAEFVFATRWPSKQYLREQAAETIKAYPLQHLFSTMKFSSTWKVAAQAPGTSPGLNDVDEDRLKAEMCNRYRYIIPTTVFGTIEPMREELLNAHSVTIDDIAEIVNRCPIVPAGRESFFTIGIHAGIHGRFVEALHVLVPQFEHFIRCGLSDTGAITSGIDQSGIQSEYDLNRMLYMKEAESLLGPDLCFCAQALFTERHGYNMRNELAHGMLSPGYFFSDAAIYAWWLIFHITGRAFAKAVNQHSWLNGT